MLGGIVVGVLSYQLLTGLHQYYIIASMSALWLLADISYSLTTLVVSVTFLFRLGLGLALGMMKCEHTE